MPLSDQRRTQLDGIVQQMVRNKEPDKNVQWVVDDFKKKYENEQPGQAIDPAQSPQPTQPKKKKGTLEKLSDMGEATFGKASDALFGATGKTVGSLINSGVASAAGLYGQATGNKKALEFEQNLNQVTKPEENITPGNIAWGFIEQYPGGGFISKYLKSIPGGAKVAEVFKQVPQNLRAKAVKQYAEALGATKEEFKRLTQKVVPELLDRGIKAKNLESLNSLATQQAQGSGKAMGDFVENLAGDIKSNITPAIEALSKMKSKYIVDGKTVNSQAVNAIDKTIDTISQFGENVSQKSIVQVKRILDESVDAGRGFVKDKITNFSDKAEKAGSDALREILAKDNPDLKILNAEFAFWNNVKKITKETLKRKSTQGRGLSQVIASTVGGTSGFASGDTPGERIKNAAIGALLGKYVSTFSSPGYKMLSSTTKNKLANLLASGKERDVAMFLAKMASTVRNLSKDSGDD